MPELSDKARAELSKIFASAGRQPHEINAIFNRYDTTSKEVDEVLRYIREIMETRDVVFVLARAMAEALKDCNKIEREVHIMGISVMLLLLGEMP